MKYLVKEYCKMYLQSVFSDPDYAVRTMLVKSAGFYRNK